MRNKKGFTLIELISVLVILAILALIVTLLVLNIIKKASTTADKRSIDAYGRAVELAITSYTMDTGYPPTNLDNLEVEYTGKTVECRVKQLKENGGLYMSECSVNGKEVKDSKTDDGYYHYGTRDLTNEEYIDMYGDALKEASLAYLEEHNEVVSDYTTLEIDYTGKEVSCDVTINHDGSIYMTNCKVTHVSVNDTNENDGYYHYGNIKYQAYNIGNKISYKNISFYVIKDSDETESTLTLLKENTLTSEEIIKYTNVSESSFCIREKTGCQAYDATSPYSSDYDTSDVKAVVDAWVEDNELSDDLEEDETSYSARLITKNELVNKLGCSSNYCSNSPYRWLYADKHPYWTMSSDEASMNSAYIVSSSGKIETLGVGATYSGNDRYGYIYYGYEVRPVITIRKSVL